MTSALSQSSEELLDSETSSAIGPCIEDDKEFVRNARGRTMVDAHEYKLIKGGKKVAFLWNTLRFLPRSLRQRVFLELLQGSDDGEDIWLWNEGDEALIEWDEDWYDQPPPWTSAATTLERRLARTPKQTPLKREFKSAAFEMRAAMIVWLALTSAAYKSADEERGRHDREEWDMQELIAVWWYSLPMSVDRWFDQCSKSYDHRAFTEVMDQAGHSCHRQTKYWEALWLFMRSQLFPNQQDHIIYLGDGDSCTPCLVHKPTRGSESPPSWTPSPALVALRDMWDNIESYYNERRDFSKWLSHQLIYGFKEANDYFSSLPQDTDGDKYLSWVNKYPSDLRHTVTRYSFKEWQAMEDCIQPSERGRSPNIRPWCAAMCWRMTPDDLLHSIRVKHFIDVWRYSGLQWWDFLLPPKPAPEFCDAIRESGHTCWKQPQMDDYAAAMAFLEEDLRVVGIDVQKDSRCQVCRLQWRLRSLGENLPVVERAFEADLTELLVMLENECSRRKVPWNIILVSVRHCNTPGPMLNSDHQEQRDLHYTLDDSVDQGHSMRTDHIDLNVPHHPQSLIPQAPHLTQDITNIFHPDMDILYIQHNSNGSQPGNYSMTPMANPITNGIPGQDSGAQYPTLHDIQPPSYTNSTRSGDVDYSAYRHVWAPYDQPMVQELEASQTQVTGRRSTPLLIPDLVNPSVENDMTLRPRSTFIEGATMTQDNPSAVSVRQANSERMMPSEHNPTTITSSRRSPERHTNMVSHTAKLPPKGQMRDEVKKFLTDAMEQHGILLQYKGNEPKLPWLEFQKTLKAHQVRVINWPDGLEQPGKDLSNDPSKGIVGVNIRDLGMIYRAIHHPTAPIRLIRDGPGENTGMYRMPDEQREVGSSRKRPRGDSDDEMSRPPKRYESLIMRL
ncbi:hypothetical protein C8J56DRAFT_1165455 [Mycena floridula]|nr:hypothetical protein C8J56DRAFT_1165455 [Mycena floridula]